ncbi:MAG: hypothetical protein FWF32_02945 [Endomicrobia bacterium]|nr:hypothetical protein [Endomicrobiia bacterium]
MKNITVKKHYFEKGEITSEIKQKLYIMEDYTKNDDFKCINATSVNGYYLLGSVGIHYTDYYKEEMLYPDYDLLNIINELEPQTLMQTAACYIFYRFPYYGGIKELRARILRHKTAVEKYPIIASLCNDSYGVLLWDWQLIAVLRLVKLIELSEAKILINNAFHRPDSESRKILQKTFIFDTDILSLFEKTSFFNHAYSPNIRDAGIIYNATRGLKQHII